MKTKTIYIILILSLCLNGFLLIQVFKSSEYNISSNETNTQETQPVTREEKKSESYANGESYPLMRVVDGDTIVVGFNGITQYVRLIGIDAPELNDPGGPQCYAEEATKHLQEILQTGLVILHFDESQDIRDNYGRLLAYVELPDGTDVGKQMIEDGYAHEFTYNTAYKRKKDYGISEADAIENERGLWAESACQ